MATCNVDSHSEVNIDKSTENLIKTSPPCTVSHQDGIKTEESISTTQENEGAKHTLDDESSSKSIESPNNDNATHDINKELKLLTSVKEFNPDNVKHLLESGYDIKEKDEAGYNAIHTMISEFVALDIEQQIILKSKAREILEMLVRKGFDVNETCYNKNTPLHLIVAYNDYPEIIRALMAAGARSNILDRKGKAPLHIATALRNDDTVMTLIEGGTDVNIQDRNGMTCLHLLAQGKRNGNLLKLLMKCGANANARDVIGRTPLHLAAKAGRVEIVKDLLELNSAIQVNQVDNAGMTPLHYCVKADLTGNVASVLLKHGAHPNITDAINKETALHKALRLQMFENVKILLKSQPRASVNMSDIRGETAIHAAAECCRDIITWQVLLTKGADLNKENHNGNKPDDVAKKFHNRVALANMQQFHDEIMI